MTLRIGIGLSFYEDFDSLRRMLMSLQSYPIDMLIAVDGAYQGYPTKKWNSSDACLELFESFQTPLHRIAGPPSRLSQNAKRQIYFDVCKEDNIDCLIVMDSDEYFISERTNWPLFMEDLEQHIKDNAHTYRQAYCIPVVLADKGVQKMPAGYSENLPRLFYRPWELRYVDDHYTIRNKKTGVMMTFEGNATLQHIVMGHDHKLRTKEYNDNTKKYEDELIEYENSVRDKRKEEFSNEIYKIRSSGGTPS
jgi:hypothetical protein